MPEVGLHGLGAEVQAGPDLGVGEAFGDEGQHLALPLGDALVLPRPVELVEHRVHRRCAVGGRRAVAVDGFEEDVLPGGDAPQGVDQLIGRYRLGDERPHAGLLGLRDEAGRQLVREQGHGTHQVLGPDLRELVDHVRRASVGVVEGNIDGPDGHRLADHELVEDQDLGMSAQHGRHPFDDDVEVVDDGDSDGLGRAHGVHAARSSHACPHARVDDRCLILDPPLR